MIQVPLEQMNEIAGLFDGNDDTLILSCLHGYMGKAWADVLPHPGSALVVTGDFCFAAGKPIAGMRQALAARDMSLEDLNAGISSWLNTLAQKEGLAQWQVANPESVGTINGWVKDKTGGKIDTILDAIKEEVVMYLINAVWFKAEWESPFTAESTVPGQFETSSGTVETPFMNRLGGMDVIEGPLGSGIVLPYTDPRFAFVAVLPNEGTTPRALVAPMDMEMLKAMVDKRENRHKTYIRVDEEGTEAAAVTSVEMSVTSMPLEGMDMRFDRPFVYAVVDVENGMPLFLGVMENPMQ